MRRIIPILTVAFLLAGSAGQSFAQFYEEGARVWYIRGSFGVAGQDLGDVENALNAEKQALTDAGFDFSTYANDFDTVWDYRVEVGGIVWNRFSVGFCYDYQPRSEDQTAAGIAAQDQFRYSEELSINYMAFLGSITYWMPGTHSLFVGGTVGYGYGKFKQTQGVTDPSNPQFTLTADGEYDGGNTVYGFNAGYAYAFDSGGLIYVQLGYEWRDLGTFSGSTTSSNQELVPDYSGDWSLDGEEVNWDFSGPFLAVGFGFTGAR
ncbi:MAG: hypothetical protein PVF33_13710 [Candidatus Latescibacterota bacterium]